MPIDLTDNKSTLVQVMAWCHQATSHYLSQCSPRSLSPYGVTRPQWVKSNSCKIVFMWMPQNTFDDMSILVQVMAWCCQAGLILSIFIGLWLGYINTLRLRQNGHHFPENTFIRIFLNEIVRISIKISLKFVPKGPINKIPALVQIMVWRRPGDKPLSEPMMIRLLTHICVTRPQGVKYKWRHHGNELSGWTSWWI